MPRHHSRRAGRSQPISPSRRAQQSSRWAVRFCWHCLRIGDDRNALFGSISPVRRGLGGVRYCAGFWTPAASSLSARSAAGVQKAPRHEVAGSWAPAGQPALWGFDVGADYDGRREAGSDATWMRADGVWKSAIGVSAAALKRINGRGGSLIGVDWVERDRRRRGASARNGKAAALTGGLAHDVSIVVGVGRHLGSQPRAKTSMTIMRAPQRGHGQGSTRGASV